MGPQTFNVKVHCRLISVAYNAVQFNDGDLEAQRKLPSARFVSHCRQKQWTIVVWFPLFLLLRYFPPSRSACRL